MNKLDFKQIIDKIEIFEGNLEKAILEKIEMVKGKWEKNQK